eukprot:CAMPEP_0183367038 /NCGR_PEP_ID=MMETSP0164_2-20130417/91067_1 /TAXON_ID=221442 /ORGANISM="Coccolithus pelagicus ssp braarudi, Strain PLY182g" /LENGTH=89 /DNA_ID=CAMNT_0025542915 /DNA_START=170 /DNA_END=439 /DNA_ORIENTATION=+
MSAIREEKASGTCSLDVAHVSKYLQSCVCASSIASSAITSAGRSDLFPTSTFGMSGLVASAASSHFMTLSNVARRDTSNTNTSPAEMAA